MSCTRLSAWDGMGFEWDAGWLSACWLAEGVDSLDGVLILAKLLTTFACGVRIDRVEKMGLFFCGNMEKFDCRLRESGCAS